jgi:hypothetical protein
MGDDIYPILPTRILLDEHGTARRPKPGDRWDVVYVRDDGWSIAARRHLSAAAKALWPDKWVSLVATPNTYFESYDNGIVSLRRL